MNWLYAMGTSPARYAVERHQWAEAAALEVPPNTFPGGRWAWTEANLHFARALGLSHTGKTEAAGMEVQKLASLRDMLAGINDKYWADQIEIQRESAEAWITLAEGKSEGALRLMRSAADHEDQTDKHNVTPGVILPAREMLGDMLLEMKQPGEALVAFESTLSTPRIASTRCPVPHAPPSSLGMTRRRRPTTPSCCPCVSTLMETAARSLKNVSPQPEHTEPANTTWNRDRSLPTPA
jgi:hypothetical protein